MADALRVTFLLPGSGHIPVGGVKIVYEYACRLAQRGHTVTVVHPARLRKDATLIQHVRSVIRYYGRRLTRQYKPTSWFEMNASVRMHWVPSLAERYIPDGDAVIATAWQTAEWVATYPNSIGRRFYLIQQLETWHGLEERVVATWRLPLRKFVIAQWLKDFAVSLGEPSEYMPNGLDFQKFALDNPPERRDDSSVMMLFHSASDKGSADGLTALSIVREKISNLRVTLFGTTRRPTGLPWWIKYHRRPEQSMLRQLYNSNAIFVAPSWTEGWALPPAEAMMCGAAVVATDIGGHRGYAIPWQTALVSPVKDPEHLARNLLTLIHDRSLRCRIAMAGNAHIQQFTWERSVSKMETALVGGGLTVRTQDGET